MNYTKIWNTIPKEAQECIIQDANNQLETNYKLPSYFQRLRKISTLGEDELDMIFNIEMLFLQWYKKLSDISFVSAFKKLQVLYIFGTNVTDISPIKDLKELITLDISHCNINSLEPLKDTNIKVLMHSHSDTHDFEHLSNLMTLEKLDLSGNRNLVSLEPFRNLTNMKGLFIGNTSVSSLRPIIHFTDLKEVWCLDAPIPDYEIDYFNTNNKSGIKAKNWI